MHYKTKYVIAGLLMSSLLVQSGEKPLEYRKRFQDQITQEKRHAVEIKDLEFVIQFPGDTKEKRAGKIPEGVERIIHQLKYAKKYNQAGIKLPLGMILYGPPGTGKTSMAKIIAGEAGRKLIVVSSSEFVQKDVEFARKRITGLFDKARSLNEPVIICIEEVDGYCKDKKSSTQGCYDQMRNTLIQELDKKDPNIFLIGTTNYIDNIDKAILSRFQSTLIEVELPDLEDRQEILKYYIKNQLNADPSFLAVLAQDTEHYSGRLLEQLVELAASIALQKDQEYIEQEDFYEALYTLNNSVVKNKDLAKKLLMHYTKEISDRVLPYLNYEELSEYIINITPLQIKNICKKTQQLAHADKSELCINHFYNALYFNYPHLKPAFDNRCMLTQYYLQDFKYRVSNKSLQRFASITYGLEALKIKSIVREAAMLLKNQTGLSASVNDNTRLYDINNALMLCAYKANEEAIISQSISLIDLLDYFLIGLASADKNDFLPRVAKYMDKFNCKDIKQTLYRARNIARMYDRQEIVEEDIIKAVYLVKDKVIQDSKSIQLLLEHFAQWNTQEMNVLISSATINKLLPLLVNHTANTLKKLINKSIKTAQKMGAIEVVDRHFIIALCSNSYISQCYYMHDSPKASRNIKREGGFENILQDVKDHAFSINQDNVLKSNTICQHMIPVSKYYQQSRDMVSEYNCIDVLLSVNSDC